MRRAFIGVLAGALVVLGTAFTGVATAANVSCGQAIGASITFDSDVGPCEEGLFVTADNVIIDLAGHTLSGPGRPELDLAGIDTNFRRNVVIRNGTVTGFAAGIAVNGGSHNTVTNMLVRDNVGALGDQGDYGDGIVIFFSHENRITRNRVIHNGTYDGIGILSGRNNLVEYNLVAQNNVVQRDAAGQPVRMQDIGIWVLSTQPGSDAIGNVLRANQVAGNGLHGVVISRFSVDNTVQFNSVAQNGFGQVPGNGEGDGRGISVEGNRNGIIGNSTLQNAADGIAVERSTMGPFVNGQINTVSRNTSRANNAGPDPAPAFDLTDTNLAPPCDGNTWSANTFGTFNQPCVTAP